MMQSDKFTIDQIKENILTFLQLGVDTTSYVLSRNILLLCQHEDVQDKLYNILKDKMDIDGDIDETL